MYDSDLEAVARGEFDLSDPTERELSRLADPADEPVHEDLGPNPIGVPYFRAEIVNHVEHGKCPRCGELVKRAPGAFAAHWFAARAREAGISNAALVVRPVAGLAVGTGVYVVSAWSDRDNDGDANRVLLALGPDTGAQQIEAPLSAIAYVVDAARDRSAKAIEALRTYVRTLTAIYGPEGAAAEDESEAIFLRELLAARRLLRKIDDFEV